MDDPRRQPAARPAAAGGLFARLFPDPPRSFRGLRGARMTLRALHVLVTGVLLGGHLFAQSRAALLPWLVATLVSGALLLALDLYASCAVLCELRGLLVLLKILLVVLAAPLWSARVTLLAAALVLGVFGSHMSGRLRHRLLLLRGRVTVDRGKG